MLMVFYQIVGDNSSIAMTPLSSDEEQLLFHCVTGLRHVILYKWEEYTTSFKTTVRNMLLAVGLGLI